MDGPEGDALDGCEIGGDELALAPAVAVADEGEGFGVEAGGEVGVGELGEAPLAGERVDVEVPEDAAEAGVGCSGRFCLMCMGEIRRRV